MNVNLPYSVLARYEDDDIIVYWDFAGGQSFNPDWMTLHVFVLSRGKALTGGNDAEKWKYPMPMSDTITEQEYIEWIYSLCDE